MGVGIVGLIDDVIAALPLEDLAALLDKKMETGEFFKTLVQAIHFPVFWVNIHFVYLNVSCCLCYAHISVWPPINPTPRPYFEVSRTRTLLYPGSRWRQ